jgi:hypothetical protein
LADANEFFIFAGVFLFPLFEHSRCRVAARLTARIGVRRDRFGKLLERGGIGVVSVVGRGLGRC